MDCSVVLYSRPQQSKAVYLSNGLRCWMVSRCCAVLEHCLYIRKGLKLCLSLKRQGVCSPNFDSEIVAGEDGAL